MYYKENNNSGLQFYYSNHSDAELASCLNDTQFRVVTDYIKFITKTKADTLRIFGGYTFKGSKVNLRTGEVKYCLSTISDELEVDSVELKNLIGPTGEVIKCYTDEAIKEIKYCCYIEKEHLYSEYICSEYPMIEHTFEVLGVNNAFDDQCKKFIDSKLILPGGLRAHYEGGMREGYRSKVYENAICDALNKKALTSGEQAIYLTDSCVFIREMRDKIMSESDRLARLNMAVRLVSFAELYDGLTGHEMRDIRVMANASMKEAYYIKAKNGERLATVNEKKQLVQGIFKKEVYFLPKEKREKLLYFTWACTGEHKWINKLNTWGEDVAITSDLAWGEIGEAIKYLRSAEFLKIDVLELQKGLKDIKYLAKADDEVIDNSNKDKIKTVYSKYKDKTDDYGKLVADICRKSLKYGTVLSEKQLRVVMKAYENLSVESESAYNKFDGALKQRMQDMMYFFSYKKTDFKYNFMSSILKNKVCSAKQKALIDEWYADYLEQKRLVAPVMEIGDDDEITDDDIIPAESDTIFTDDAMDISEFEDEDSSYGFGEDRKSKKTYSREYNSGDDRDIQSKLNGIKGVNNSSIKVPDMTKGLVW